MEIVTIERGDLERLIESTVTRALERVLTPKDEMMNKREAAKYLKKSLSTVTRWMSQGMPHHGNGHPTFKKSEIDAWIARN